MVDGPLLCSIFCCPSPIRVETKNSTFICSFVVDGQSPRFRLLMTTLQPTVHSFVTASLFACLLLAIPFLFSHLWRIIVIDLSYCMLSYVLYTFYPRPLYYALLSSLLFDLWHLYYCDVYIPMLPILYD